MEPRQQLEAWSKQAADAGKEAKADFDVALRLLKHGIETLDEIERLREALRIAQRFCNSLSAEDCPDTVAIKINEALIQERKDDGNT